MKVLYKILITVFIIGLLGWFFYPERDLVNYSSDTYQISFSYPSEYELTEQDISNNQDPHHRIVLINKKDLPPPVNGEGPTSIVIDIYGNTTNKYNAESWARNSKDSNLNLGDGTIATTTISGLPAISFRWSGLYDGTTIVSTNSNLLYTFNVTYMEMGANIVQDFVKVRDSVQIQNAPTIIYTNTDYGFTFTLPTTWQGYRIVKNNWTGTPLESSVGTTGPKILIRNPKWTEVEPYEDLPILVFTIAQWDAYMAEEFSVSAAPIAASELGRNNKYVFALPPRWNFDYLTGVEEAQTIIEGRPLHSINP